jgi:hypothetical protein
MYQQNAFFFGGKPQPRAIFRINPNVMKETALLSETYEKSKLKQVVWENVVVGNVRLFSGK